MKIVPVVFVVSGVLVSPGIMAAQGSNPTLAPGTTSPVPAGTRVRLRTRPRTGVPPSYLIGDLVEWTAEGAVIDTGRGQRELARREIVSLDVSGGRRSRGRGALLGAAAGAAVGIVLGLMSGGDDSCQIVCFTRTGTAMIGVVAFAPVGAMAGAIAPTERWRSVSLPTPATPPPPRGVTMLSLRF